MRIKIKRVNGWWEVVGGGLVVMFARLDSACRWADSCRCQSTD